MKKLPLVTVALFNFNGFSDTKKCLQSLQKTKYPKYEIFVIDDGSKGNDIERLQRVFKNKNITFFKDGVNKGFSARVNQVIALSKAKYITLLNNDTTVDPYWLSQLVASAEKDSHIAVCQSKLRWMQYPDYFEYAGASGGYIDVLGYPYTRGRVMFTIEKDLGQYDDEADIFWGCGAAMLIRRDIAKKIGGFDTDLFSYQEEIDFCWRIRKAGYTVKIVPSSIVYHKGMGYWASKLTKKTFLVHRNNLILLLRHLSFVELLWVLPLRVGFEGLSFFYYLFERKWSYAGAMIRAYISVLYHNQFWLTKRSKGKNPKRGPFSIVLDYYLFGKRTYSAITGGKQTGLATLNYEKIFLEREKVHKKFPSFFHPQGERTDEQVDYLAPTFFQHKRAYSFCLPYSKEKQVVEIGSGTGYGAHLLAQTARKVIGIDLDPEAISLAKERYKKKNLTFHQSDASEVFDTVKNIDVIISLQVIEHLENAKDFLQELSKSMSKNSLLILSTPNTLTQGYNENPYHVKEFSPNELQAILSKLFSSVEMFGVHGNQQVLEYENNRKKNVLRIMHLDRCNIRKIIPRRLRILFFEVFIPVVRKSINPHKNTYSIREDSYYINKKLINSIDMIAVCKK